MFKPTINMYVRPSCRTTIFGKHRYNNQNGEQPLDNNWLPYLTIQSHPRKQPEAHMLGVRVSPKLLSSSKTLLGWHSNCHSMLFLWAIYLDHTLHVKIQCFCSIVTSNWLFSISMIKDTQSAKPFKLLHLTGPGSWSLPPGVETSWISEASAWMIPLEQMLLTCPLGTYLPNGHQQHHLPPWIQNQEQ